MSFYSLRQAFVCLVPVMLLSGHAFAQMTVTGAIAGTVKDATGQVVVAAKVTITSEETADTRAATTNELGDFNFAAVKPGTYSLKVEAKGFKTFQRNGLVLSANQRVALGDLALERWAR